MSIAFARTATSLLCCLALIAGCAPADGVRIAEVRGGGAPLPEAPACALFPADSYWYAPVDDLSPLASSPAWVDAIGADANLVPDFGSGLFDGGPIGIPYDVVGDEVAHQTVAFDFDDESDPGPYPIPDQPSIEGGPDADGDRHVLIVDEPECTLYELFDARPLDGGGWSAGSGAVWDLTSNALRPDTWTSADAAGLPILPGLVRYDEVAAGVVDHAIRITAPRTDRSYVWPARHQAGAAEDASLPPLGARFRLSADIDPADFPPQARPIVVALQTYGAILADNGSSWFISGAPDERWDNDQLRSLRDIPGSAFEAVDTTPLIVDPDSGRAAGPGGPVPPPPPAMIPLGDGDPATTERIAVVTAEQTGVAISARRFADGQAAHAVLGRDDAFPDSLAATPLTGVGPLLLSPTTGLSTAVAAELSRVLPAGATVYLLGGTAALSEGVEQEVRDLGFSPARLAGPDRIATAVVIAREVAARQGGAARVAIARAFGEGSAGWADSVTGGAWAAATGTPVLLTPTDGLDGRVAEVLAELGVTETVVLGGTAAVSDAVVEALPSPRRVAGADRAETAVRIAEDLVGSTDDVVLVNGYREDGWIFGLAAAGLAAQAASPLLLTTEQTLPPATRDALGAGCGSGAPAVELLVIGDETVVTPQVVAEADRQDGGDCGTSPTQGAGGPPELDAVFDLGGAQPGRACGGDVTCVAAGGSIQAALDAAPDGGVVQVQAGSFAGDLRVQGRTVQLLGGFSADFTGRDPLATPTVLTGSGTDSVVRLEQAGTTLLDGFTITGGVGNDDEFGGDGGGVYVDGGAPTITHNLIQGNDLGPDQTDGGGIYVQGAPAVIRGNIIRANSAFRGGGIGVDGGNAVIADNLVEDNVGTGDHGGGLYLFGEDLLVRGNLIRGNTVGESLGYGWGGGLIVVEEQSTARLEHNRFTDNSAPSIGSGVFIDEGATAHLLGDLIHANRCSADGAGIYVDGLPGSVVTLENVTVADHPCTGEGVGGEGLYVEGASRVSILNSIFFGNGGDDLLVCTDPAGQSCNGPTSSLDVAHSLIESGASGPGVLTGDPLFVDAAAGNLRLRAQSPAIDAADPSSPVGDEPQPNGGRRNLGSYGGTAAATTS